MCRDRLLNNSIRAFAVDYLVTAMESVGEPFRLGKANEAKLKSFRASAASARPVKSAEEKQAISEAQDKRAESALFGTWMYRQDTPIARWEALEFFGVEAAREDTIVKYAAQKAKYLSVEANQKAYNARKEARTELIEQFRDESAEAAA